MLRRLAFGHHPKAIEFDEVGIHHRGAEDTKVGMGFKFGVVLMVSAM
jgi:hypothetical protein